LGNNAVDKSAALNQAEFQIKIAGFAGGALAVLTLAQIFFPFAGLSPAVVMSAALHRANENISILGLPPYLFLSWFDLVLVGGLAIATFMKNKICSMLLFVYGAIAFLSSLPTASGHIGFPTFLIVVILVFLFYGMTGTFAYYKARSGLVPGQQ
jgi:hypothetical protein